VIGLEKRHPTSSVSGLEITLLSCVCEILVVFHKAKCQKKVTDQFKMEDREERNDALQKILFKFTKKDDLVHLGQRLLQRVPTCLGELSVIADESASADVVPFLREYLMNVAREATCSDRPDHLSPLPKSVEKYVAYCDILFRMLHLGAFNWQTFVLQDYDAAVHNSLTDDTQDAERQVDIEHIHSHVRKFLKKSGKFGFVSTQVEVSPNVLSGADTEALLLRVATVAHSDRMDRAQQETRVMKKAPVYYVYVPGEPYFYASVSQPCPDTCQAIVDFLKCSGYQPVSLVGHDLSSLRQLRINRDVNQDTVDTSFKVSGGTDLPKLQSFTVECQSKFRTPLLEKSTHDFIRRPDNDPLAANNALLEGNEDPDDDSFTFKAVFTGPDVLKGFDNLCQEGYFHKPYPNWMTQAPQKGRNTVKIRPKQNQSQEKSGIGGDVMSIAGSDMTAVLR